MSSISCRCERARTLAVRGRAQALKLLKETGGTLFGHLVRDFRILAPTKRQSPVADGAGIGELELGNSVSEECVDVDNSHQLLVLTVSLLRLKHDVSSILELHTISLLLTG